MSEKLTPRAETEQKRLTVFTLELRGLRPEQQDVADIKHWRIKNEKVCVAVVADGHGRKGKEAASIARDVILHGIESATKIDGDWLRGRFLAAHEKISRDAKASGATVSVTFIHGEKLYVAYVGDSEVRIAKKDGHLETLAIPHKYGLNKAETRRLDDSGASIYQKRIFAPTGTLEPTRTLGDEEFEPHVLHVPQIIEKKLLPEDKFLITATDGFWNVATKNSSKRRKVEKILADAKNIEEAERGIKEFLNTQKLHDNTTLVVFGLQ